MKHSEKRSVLLQYILLYATAVFLPVLIVFLSLMQSNRALEEEIVKYNHTCVQLVQNTVDATILDFNNVLNQLGTSAAFSRIALISEKPETIAALQSIKDAHPYLSNVIVTVRGQDRYYSNNGNFYAKNLPYQTYLDSLNQPNVNANHWSELAQSVTAPTYWPTGLPDSQYLFLFSPVYYDLQMNLWPNNRTAVLVIRRTYIDELLRTCKSLDDESLFLLDENYQLISTSAGLLTDEQQLNICQYIRENIHSLNNHYMELADSDMLLFISRSEKTGLNYARLLPKSTAYQTLELNQVYTQLLPVLAIVIGVIMACMGIRRSYFPIHSLANWVRNRQDVDRDVHNELTLFRMALDDALTQKEALTQVVDTSRHGLVDHLLGDLICGNFDSEEEFHAACQNLSVDLNKKYYAVCSLLIEQGSDIPSFGEIFAAIRSDLPRNLQVEAKDMLLDRKLILVLSCDNNDMLQYEIAVTDIKNRLLEQESLLTSIGMGAFYDSYELVGKSYLDSTNALDYRMVYGKDCLITPDIYISNTPGLSDSYPSTDLELLDSSLASHNTDMAATVIHRINNHIKLKNYSLHIAKYICYDIFSILKKNAESVELGAGHTLSHALNITSLTNYGTIDEFFNALSDLVQTKFDSEISGTAPTHANIGKQLLEYIDAHCLSYDFQIKNVAEHFSITPQYMRKLFKSHTGMSISEYVSNKRLEKAMYLLVSTDMNLQDIVVEIGNSDISGFVRFFKQKTGMTPGQYRKTNTTKE